MKNKNFEIIISSKTIIWLMLVITTFSACKKNQDVQIVSPLAITGISPESGAYATVVTITGTGFSSNTADNAVKFNNSNAVVQTASATQLVVVVPKGAGSGAVTVQTAGKTSTGPDFTYTYTITVSTFAGSGVAGYVEGMGTAAQFNGPIGMAADAQGNIYIADNGNNVIRKITPSGLVSTFAGSGAIGYADGSGATAQFNILEGLASDAQGNIYVADGWRIRKITTAGNVSTLAGSTVPGHLDGTGAAAQFLEPSGIAADAQGNIYVADQVDNSIRKITQAGVVTTIAGTGVRGYVDGPGVTAQFNSPGGIEADTHGNIYVAEPNNRSIRKITASGIVSTFISNNSGAAMAIDANDNLYLTVNFGQQGVFEVTPAAIESWLAGSETLGYADGPGTTALFDNPWAIAVDAHGSIYVAEYSNHIRKIIVE